MGDVYSDLVSEAGGSSRADAVRFKVKVLLPISPLLLVLALLTFAGLHLFLLAVAWLGMQIGRDFEGLCVLLWVLAGVTTLLSAVLVLVRPRWIAWGLLLLAYSFTAAFTVVRGQESARERRELNQRYAPARLAANRLLLENALIKAVCADGVTLTLNRKDFGDGDTVMSVSAVPMNRTHQHHLIVVLNNKWSDQLVRNLSRFRPRLEPYKSRGSHSCQQNIDTMFKQLESFSQSSTKLRNN